MNRVLKITVAMVLALSMCLIFVGCDKDEEETDGMVNPMTEVDEQGLIEATGIDMPAPEGAEDVQYFVIRGKDTVMGEMRFTLDGKSAYLRSMETSLTSLLPENTEMDDPPEREDIRGNGDISGLYYDWETFEQTTICDRQAYCERCGDVGYIAWLDAVPGVLYNLGMEKDADLRTLVDLAEKVFVPVQGND